jgi:membrane fusion protein
MNPPLFREEALGAQVDRLYGATLTARSPALTLLTLGAAVMAAAIISFLVLAHYTRKEHVTGYLAPSAGLIKVFTPQLGTVVAQHVAEGQTVAQGEVLLVVSSERATATTQQAQAQMLQQLRERRDSLRQELDKRAGIDELAAEALRKRIHTLQAELEQAQRQIELQRSGVASAVRTVQRHERLVTSGFVSQATLQQKQEELLDRRSQLVASQRSVVALTRDLDAARLELASSALTKSNNAAAIERQISELEQQLTDVDSRREVVITAPADGTVTTILAQVGQSAAPGTPLLSILPAGAELEAHLLVPTRAAGFIRPDQTVALRYQAFPYQRFGHYLGEVREVGRTILQPQEAALPLPVQEPVYRITVKLPAQRVQAYGQSLALQSGMVLDADIWVDRRRLIEWVVDPLLSVVGRV